MNKTRLANIVKISKGKKYTEDDSSNLRYIQIDDLRNNNNLKYCLKQAKMVLCTEKDVLIAWDGANAGTIGFGLKGAIGSTLAKLEIIHEGVFTPYLGKFLQSKFRYLRDQCTGATIPHISRPVLLDLEIPLPPLKTQKKIASILDDAQALKQKTEQLLKEYDELAQSIFLDMFGDPVTNPKGLKMDLLKDVALINMGQSPKGSSYNDQGNGAPLLNGPTEFGVKFPKEKQWTSEPRKMSTKGDILFCVRGATAGRLNWSDKEYCIGRGLASIRSKGEVSDEYLYILLERMYDYFQKTSVGSTFINISRDDLGKVKVPRTTVKFQNQFAEKIKLIEQQKELAKQELKESEDLFQALLQKAFKGELV